MPKTEAKQIGCRRILSFDVDPISNTLGIIGEANGQRLLFFMSPSLATIGGPFEVDGTKLTFSISGRNATTNGNTPLLLDLTRDSIERVELKPFSKEVPVSHCQLLKTNLVSLFLDNSDFIVVSTDCQEIVVERALQCDAILDQWLEGDDVFVATWTVEGVEAKYSIVNVSRNEVCFTTRKYRSKPILLENRDLLIANSGVFYDDAWIERYVNSEQILRLPFQDDYLNLVSRGSSGTVVLHEQVSMRSWHRQRQIAVWSTETRARLLDFTAGTGAATLCSADSMVATLERAGGDALVKTRTIAAQSVIREQSVSAVHRYIHCPYGSDTVVLVDQQPGAITQLELISVTSI
jgi:hypothetical protein